MLPDVLRLSYFGYGVAGLAEYDEPEGIAWKWKSIDGQW
ncbi:MAG: hypothetical protein JETT_1293 [Candidatus Jettenia ecosi]|uniref:Uncharacterized protein n=1 Tax=Candidatus Jettenia ecosi TaxID=2494326 RepID=A0A533QD02_9BACT|nr:MAG: hypothetical protein JETT_1293 [Candidatus Jettenia ecosi]